MNDYSYYFLQDCNQVLPLRYINEVDDSLIATYLSLPKLLYLLTCSELYFCRLDKLEDAYEGNAIFGIEKKEDFKGWSEMFSINSWNLYPRVESFRLWKIYLEGNYGVAIISEINSVFKSMTGPKSDYINAHPVNYLRYDCPPIEATDPYTNAITKKEFYLFENEIRFMLYSSEGKGTYIPVNLNKLVHKVIFSPYNPDWVNKSIKKLFEKYLDGAILFEKSKILINY